MNFKLIILIFALFGVQTISSSILKNQMSNNEEWIEVDYVNEENEFVNYFGKPSEPETKEFTLNKSETVVIRGERLPEIRCLDKYFEKDTPNKFCDIGNGKYQYELAKCRRNSDPNRMTYQCKFFAKVTNKNVQWEIRTISCNGGIFYGEPHKGNCALKYVFANSESYDEKDDVLNDEF